MYLMTDVMLYLLLFSNVLVIIGVLVVMIRLKKINDLNTAVFSHIVDLVEIFSATKTYPAYKGARQL